MPFAFRLILSAALLAGLSWYALAARPAGSVQCYKAEAPVACFTALAKGRLKLVADPNDRADAIVELLYSLAGTGGQDDALLKEAMDLSGNEAVRPVKQMDLMYSIDLYGSAAESLPEQTFVSAIGRFAKLEGELKGGELIELYLGACAIIGWDEASRERWLPFAQNVCAPQRLRALKAESVADRALLLAMMPVAMTFGEDAQGFVRSAELGLNWLSEAEKLAAKSKRREERDFVAFMGVLMHALNAFCLEAFEFPDGADGEAELALKTLRRFEKRAGQSGLTTPLRRQVVEILFRMEREGEAKKLLREMLVRVDADPNAKKIPAAEQIAILSLAARIEHEEAAARKELQCVPEGTVAI